MALHYSNESISREKASGEGESSFQFSPMLQALRIKNEHGLQITIFRTRNTLDTCLIHY